MHNKNFKTGQCKQTSHDQLWYELTKYSVTVIKANLFELTVIYIEINTCFIREKIIETGKKS